MTAERRERTASGVGVAERSPELPVQRSEELGLVKRYVLLGVVLRILDHDIRAVGSASVKLPRLYASMLRGLQDRVLLEMAAIRKQFRKMNIKLCEESRDADALKASYICRGYQHRFSIRWSAVRLESERMLRTYFSG